MTLNRVRFHSACMLALLVFLGGCAARRPPDFRMADPWWYQLIGMPGVRALGLDGTNRKVAVVDSGIQADHEDLQPRVAAGTTLCSGGNPQIDRNGHGTQMAGIAAGNDGTGSTTRGVASKAGLIPIQVLCTQASITTAAWVDSGVAAATAAGADVIVLSLATWPPGGLDGRLGTRMGQNPAVLFVIASVWDLVDSRIPSGLLQEDGTTTRENLIIVAGMKVDGTSGTEVVYDAHRGDLYAPGYDVDTASIGGVRPPPAFQMQGSSPAAALVSGCAALAKQKTPSAMGKDLKAVLLSKATKSVRDDPANAPTLLRLDCLEALK